MGDNAAVIADIVGSRILQDRAGAQQAIVTMAEKVHADLPVATAPLAATVGDEFQAVFPGLTAAVASLLLVQLGLPEGVQLRFGIGVGAVDPIDESITDGPGWWAAREAIDDAHRLQDRAVPHARTRIAAAAGQDAVMHERIAYANAYLLARDELVASMSERTRRLTYGRCLGRTQRELADAEGISQPAVSQALASAGSAALVAGFADLVRGLA
ncbi:SatD family protein [Microbacterium oleivorans]|uniref:SatD family protein n=1 Tax=Microbacterium TaxID=33882 RepID=UPI00204167E1|nr:SatD family protein [Microbacterium oleivorans]MCM3697457.1 SatD family protein [Microbacterium oleivorans]